MPGLEAAILLGVFRRGSATRSTTARKNPAETSNHLRVGEPAATRRVALRRMVRPNQSRDLDRGFAPSWNPNGIPSQSPGLRGTSYPGLSSIKRPQPQRGCGHSVPARAPDVGHNAVGVVSISERAPKVGAGAPTLGWRPQSLWDCSRRGSATRSIFARKDPAETSNHLRVGEPAAARRVALRSRIPTGFRRKAHRRQPTSAVRNRRPRGGMTCGRSSSVPL
jgi:hypothetical protein